MTEIKCFMNNCVYNDCNLNNSDSPFGKCMMEEIVIGSKNKGCLDYSITNDNEE